jgi:ribosomal-protein-alanine N-acetyltransferase
MSEALDLFCRYGFEKYQVIRIYAEPYASNLASGRVLEKAGFTLEGRLKYSVYKEGEVLDQLMYARINPHYL